MEKLKEVDKRILKGTILLVCFLIVWFISMPNDEDIDNIKNLINKENDEAQRKQTQDIDSYNQAIISENKLYCLNIYNSSLKEECEKRVPEIREQIIKPEPTEEETMDTYYYNHAIINNKNSFCDEIKNETLRKECKERIPN